MTWPSAVDLSELELVYVAASSPSFLYDRYRRSQALQKLASLLSVDQLVQKVKDVQAMNERGLEDVTHAYAALIALSFHPYTSWRDALRELDLSGLRWGKRIGGMLKNQGFSTGILTLNLPPRVPSVIALPSAASSNTNVRVSKTTIEVARGSARSTCSAPNSSLGTATLMSSRHSASWKGLGRKASQCWCRTWR